VSQLNRQERDAEVIALLMWEYETLRGEIVQRVASRMNVLGFAGDVIVRIGVALAIGGTAAGRWIVRSLSHRHARADAYSATVSTCLARDAATYRCCAEERGCPWSTSQRTMASASRPLNP
jgi:hypothetical protein